MFVRLFLLSVFSFLRIYFEVLISWRESFFVKLIYCDASMYVRTVVSTTIMWHYSPHYIYTCRDLPSPKSILVRLSACLALSKVAITSTIISGSFGWAHRSVPRRVRACVHDYISCTGFIWIWLWSVWPMCEVGWGPLKPWDDSFHDCFQW